VKKYKELGIEELYLPTTDHFEPSVKDIIVRTVAAHCCLLASWKLS
jgi:hypothetical protein